MNSFARNASSHNSNSDAGREGALGSAEATLRLLARLPAPEGLEDRVMAGLKSAPRSARVLRWPMALQPAGSWMRGAAAAAIVFVVAGGGWGIYSRVQPAQPGRAVTMPPHVGAAGGFSSAGAMRTPETLKGPVLTQPVIAKPVQAKPLPKAPAQIAPAKSGRTEAQGRAIAHPALTAVE